MFSRTSTIKSTGSCWDKKEERYSIEKAHFMDKRHSMDFRHSVDKAKGLLESADTVVIGAGAGLSASAGFTYSGKRFKDNFPDFIEKYGFRDMYSAGFYPYGTPEEYWAYWSRYIFINRYQDAPKSVYNDLFRLVQDKDYFVLTTNVDHCFQKAGFDKQRLFYTQGDYGLWITSFSLRAFIRTGCFTPKEITGCGNAQSPVTQKPTITKPLLSKWLPNRKICASRPG